MKSIRKEMINARLKKPVVTSSSRNVQRGTKDLMQAIQQGINQADIEDIEDVETED